MAQIKLTDHNKQNKLNAIQNNTGTARTDEFFFEIGEVNVNELHAIAFKKDFIITVTNVNEKISKMVFLNTLT